VRVTKRQLKRIIREEKRKVLAEQQLPDDVRQGSATNVTSTQVLDVLYSSQGVCFDQEEWEFLIVATKICKLFGIEYPNEWDEEIEAHGGY